MALAEGTRVRVAASNDDWPNREGVIGHQLPGREWNWVQFEDGEGGEYPDEALEVLNG